jgi:hypothetical protein
MFLGGYIGAVVLFVFKLKNLDKHLPRILYFDRKGFSEKKILARKYFGMEEPEADENKKDSPLQKSPKVVDEKRDQELQLRDNIIEQDNTNAIPTITNELQVNNFIQSQSDDKQLVVKKTNHLISLPDYEELGPDDVLLFDKRTSTQLLKDNILTDHPIFSLIFKKSIFDPAFLRVLDLVFQYSIQFSVNAMFFTDNLIESRMSNPNKVKFY